MAVTGDPRKMLAPPPPAVAPDAAGPLSLPGSPQAMGVPLAGTAPRVSFGAPNYTSPSDLTGSTFLGHAPTATPYGDFTAPNPMDVANDPYYQFRSREGEKAIQRSAAARGTLLNGGTLKALEGYRQGLASEEANNAFNRALSVYDTNRDTNAQNFGQATTQFRGDLDIFGANRPPASAPGGGSSSASASGLPPVMGSSDQTFGYAPGLSGDYAASVAASRAANDRANALTSSIRPRMLADPFAGRVNRGALA